MSIEVRVGTPVLTIDQGSTFMVTDQGGEIDAQNEQGGFAEDTRFVSQYQPFINEERWELLTSAAATRYDEAQVQLTNPPLSLLGAGGGP